MKKIILLVFASVVLLSAMFSLTKESTSLSEAIIYVDPSTNDLSVGNIFVVNISVADVADLSSFGFCLGYNTTILDVLSVWVPPPFEPPIIIPPSDGYIHVAAKSPIPFSGSGTLASITFNVTVLGSSILDLYDATLFDSTGDPIPYTIVDGSVMVSSVIIKVPGDYPTIQEAINAASDGDTIFVCNGTYYEHVVVNKSVLLIGENMSTTIVDGSGLGTVMYIMANNVTINGFTIRNSDAVENGISLGNSSYCTIRQNNITDNGNGIFGYGGSFNIFADNFISRNHLRGIDLGWAGFEVVCNEIKGNMIHGNHYFGIHLFLGRNNVISQNNISNQNVGLQILGGCRQNVIQKNIFSEDDVSIYLYAYSDLEWPSNNLIIENTIEVLVVDPAENNVIYHNNFLESSPVAIYRYGINVWDNGYPSGGNYWSDYTGVDADGDGIGDTPYVIDADNKDHYPLMHPWSPFPVHNINTGLGYAAIQEAINAPETLDGYTVFVEAGTYYENLVVNKTVSLFGENIDTTIIDGSETGDCVNVTASSTKISGFTIRNGGSKPFTAYASVRLFTSGNTILNNNLISSWCGVWMEHYSDYNLIANNTIMGNLNGIAGEIWHNTKIIGNTIKDNLMGIWIGPYSQNNIISFNNINGHWSEGIMMMQSSNNTFEGNNIVDNNQGGSWAGITIGFQKGFSSGNKFFHNNIANMGKQIELQGESEPVIWDDGYPSGGNYWSDYTGVDYHSGTYQNETGSDGVGDTPYTVDVNNQDNYPLMGMFSVFNATSEYNVQTICNSSISNFQFNGSAIIFNISGENGTTGFCRMCIPTDLMNGSFKVFVNGTEVQYNLLPCSNTTHSYLYFTYNHSTQEVIAIPEFPTWTSMLLILIVLTVAIVIYKRILLKTPIH